MDLSDLAYKPHTKTDITEEQVGQELFLHDAANPEAVHALNDGAAIIWLLCNGTRDLVTIAEEISVTYGVPKSQVLTDVQETVECFQSLGLLEAKTTPSHQLLALVPAHAAANALQAHGEA